MHQSFLAQVAKFAFQRSLVLTDKLAVIAGVLVPAVAAVVGPMPAWVAGYIAWGIIVAVAFGVVARLLAAPYLIWREQNSLVSALQSDLSKPAYLQNQRLAEHYASARADLAATLGEIGSTAERHIPARSGDALEAMHGAVETAQKLLQQFIDERELVQLSRDYIQSALIVIDMKNKHENYSEELKTLDMTARKLFPMLRVAG